MAVDIKKLETRFEKMFSQPDIEKYFWDWYNKKRIKEYAVKHGLPLFCKDKKAKKDEPCKYKINTCVLCFNP